MKAQTWRGVTLLVALAMVILAMLASCQGQARDLPSATEGPGQTRLHIHMRQHG
jgi:hypothetical protein